MIERLETVEKLTINFESHFKVRTGFQPSSSQREAGS